MTAFRANARIGWVYSCLLLLFTGCASLRAPIPSPEADNGFALDGIPLYPSASAAHPVVLAMVSDFWDPPSRWTRLRPGWKERRIATWDREASEWAGLLRARGLWMYVEPAGEPGEAEQWARQGVPVIVYLQSLLLDEQTRFPAVLTGYDADQHKYRILTGAPEPVMLDAHTWTRMRGHADQKVVWIAPVDRDEPHMKPTMWFARGRLWMGESRYAHAARDFNRAWELAPQQPEYAVELADAHLFMHAYAQAEPLYRAALNMDSLHARAMNNLAYLLLTEQRQPEEALLLARNAVARQPDNARFWHTLGWAHERNGALDEAARAWERARTRAMRSLPPRDQAAIAMRLVTLYDGTGQPHLARQTLADALELDPDTYVPPALRRHLRPHHPVYR